MERLVWISDVILQSQTHLNYERVNLYAKLVITSLSLWDTDAKPVPPIRTRKVASNRGFLEDGSAYVVYRFALYVDGFKQVQSLSDTRYVDVCYLLPLGLTQSRRGSSSSARIISLVPHAQSSNELLHGVLANFLAGTVEGVPGIFPDGSKVRMFLDMVAFFGDYPAASAVSDVKEHTANSFSTV